MTQRILIDIIIPVKIKIPVDFIRNIISTEIPVISTKILINLTEKLWFVHFQPDSSIFFSVSSFPVIRRWAIVYKYNENICSVYIYI